MEENYDINISDAEMKRNQGEGLSRQGRVRHDKHGKFWYSLLVPALLQFVVF
jgi:hypothetical protein